MSNKDSELRKLALSVTNQWQDHNGYTKCFTNRMCDKCIKVVNLLANHSAEVEKRARVDDLNTFVAQLHNNHNDMPIGTPSQYVTEQQLKRLDDLTQQSKTSKVRH